MALLYHWDCSSLPSDITMVTTNMTYDFTTNPGSLTMFKNAESWDTGGFYKNNFIGPPRRLRAGDMCEIQFRVDSLSSNYHGELGCRFTYYTTTPTMGTYIVGFYAYIDGGTVKIHGNYSPMTVHTLGDLGIGTEYTLRLGLIEDGYVRAWIKGGAYTDWTLTTEYDFDWREYSFFPTFRIWGISTTVVHDIKIYDEWVESPDIVMQDDFSAPNVIFTEITTTGTIDRSAGYNDVFETVGSYTGLGFYNTVPIIGAAGTNIKIRLQQFTTGGAYWGWGITVGAPRIDWIPPYSIGFYCSNVTLMGVYENDNISIRHRGQIIPAMLNTTWHDTEIRIREDGLAALFVDDVIQYTSTSFLGSLIGKELYVTNTVFYAKHIYYDDFIVYGTPIADDRRGMPIPIRRRMLRRGF